MQSRSGVRHNLLYWRYGEYAGAGPAHTAGWRKAKTAWRSSPRSTPESGANSSIHKATASSRKTVVPPADQASEVPPHGPAHRRGHRPRPLCDPRRPRDRLLETRGMKSMGLIKRQGQRLMTTADGRKLLNAVIAETGQLALPCPSSRRKPGSTERLNGSRLSPG